MRTTMAFAVMSLACIAGCNLHTVTTAGPGGVTTQKGSGDAVGNIIHGSREAARRIETANQLKNIHLLIETASGASGAMPSKDDILAMLKKEDQKSAKLVEDGVIVLTGARQREGIWAYEKDAPTKGGWVITQNGPERVTADEFKQKQANN